MRQSTARLVNSSVRLSELRFPSGRVHIPRARLAFIHLDNLLHFAKADRDGRVDGFVVAYLPDEVALLLLRAGEPVNAIAIAQAGRMVLPIPAALKHMRQELERGELTFCDAPAEQLAWMYESCAAPAQPKPIDAQHPESLFAALHREQFTGVVELISDGRVSYLRVEAGEFAGGHFCDRPPEMPVPQYVESLFAPHEDGSRPDIAAAVFPGVDTFPVQASPDLIHNYRELFWAVADGVDRETSGSGKRHVDHFRELLKKIHTPLEVIGVPLDAETDDIVATSEELTSALADWTEKVLEQVEIVSPGAAPALIRDATREHRFLLQKAGFYERLPWTVSW